MKTLKIFLLFIFITSLSLPQNVKEKRLPLFRDFEWKTNPETVKDKETSRYLQTFSGFGVYALSYRGEFLGISSRIDFSFKDSLLVEGSYILRSDLSYKNDFIKIRDYFSKQYGKPKYWAIRKINDAPLWIKETDLGTFRGPELFWEFDDGFIAIQSSKYIEDITITVLYVYDKKINDYGSADVFIINY